MAVILEYKPEKVKDIGLACIAYEGGVPMIRVHGDGLISMICYGGKKDVVPTVYFTDVPKKDVIMFALAKKDFAEFMETYYPEIWEKIRKMKTKELRKLISKKTISEVLAMQGVPSPATEIMKQKLLED